MKLLSVAGARPNFMKLAAIARAVEDFNKVHPTDTSLITHLIVHTGQHYGERMSRSFFEELAIPKPDINLEVGSGSHALQTAEIMRRFEPVLLSERPDVLLVVGDVNSTIACALVAAKIEYPAGSTRKRPVLVHVEAGLRSFDPDMPEEINRILVDNLSDLLFVTEESGLRNLAREGISKAKVYFVGNVMIDTLQRHLEKARISNVRQRFNLPEPYGIVTLHRPSNVDSQETLHALLEALHEIAKTIPLIFPIHPRTLKQVEAFNLTYLLDRSLYSPSKIDMQPQGSAPAISSGIYLIPPLGYLDFLHLMEKATLVITDSGGIQEETTFLKIPCMTLRENTERPITVTVGSNYLVGTTPADILATAAAILTGDSKPAGVPEMWDGLSGKRIVEIIWQKYRSTAAPWPNSHSIHSCGHRCLAKDL